MILDEIAEQTKLRIEKEKLLHPLFEVKSQAMNTKLDTGFPFEKALREHGMSFICEVKKASPSKGLISSDFSYLEIAKEYQDAGAAAISVLTEPYYFMGSDSYLEQISKTVKIPVLRKDFFVDEYMIYKAKLLGASAILLICAILDDRRLNEYLEIAHRLGLSALVEAHTAEETVRAVNSGARIIGINNRDLKTFKVDIENSLRLRDLVPKDRVFVSESGIKTVSDIERLREIRADAVLIGETLMTSSDKKSVLNSLRGDKI